MYVQIGDNCSNTIRRNKVSLQYCCIIFAKSTICELIQYTFFPLYISFQTAAPLPDIENHGRVYDPVVRRAKKQHETDQVI